MLNLIKVVTQILIVLAIISGAIGWGQSIFFGNYLENASFFMGGLLLVVVPVLVLYLAYRLIKLIRSL